MTYEDHETELTPAENLAAWARQYGERPTDENRQALTQAIQQWQAEDAPDVEVRPVTYWKDEPEPARVLWRDGANDPVLSEGETAVLAAPGGSGKSYLALALALAAGGWNGGKACGLEVRRGPAVLIGYEDAPARVSHRLRLMTEGGNPGAKDPAAGIHLVDNPPPLMAGDPRRPGTCAPCDAWPKLWEALERVRPSLLVIDPVSVALAANQNDAAQVRAFLSAVTTEAAEIGAGVLLVAHDTKAARNEAKAGGNPGAGAIAGSGQWHDGARGVLYLHAAPGGRKVLECIKSNYGRSGWGAALKETYCGQTFAGYALADRLDDEEAVKAAREGADDDGQSGLT